MIDNKLIKTEKYFNLKRKNSFWRATNEYSRVFDVFVNQYKCTHLDRAHMVNTNIPNECNSCIYLPLCQGGCSVKDLDKDRCYIYKYCFNEVLNAIIRLRNIDARIMEDK